MPRRLKLLLRTRNLSPVNKINYTRATRSLQLCVCVCMSERGRKMALLFPRRRHRHRSRSHAYYGRGLLGEKKMSSTPRVRSAPKASDTAAAEINNSRGV